MRRRDWLAHLVRMQLAVGAMGQRPPPAADEPAWPARLMRAGTVLAAVGGLALFIWLRRRL
jgi:hypothetical protein